jgi:hypothetical protein
MVFVLSMGQRGIRNCVVLRIVPIRLRREEFVSDMGPRWHYVRWRGVGSKRSMGDCVGHMGGRGDVIPVLVGGCVLVWGEVMVGKGRRGRLQMMMMVMMIKFQCEKSWG